MEWVEMNEEQKKKEKVLTSLRCAVFLDLWSRKITGKEARARLDGIDKMKQKWNK